MTDIWRFFLVTLVNSDHRKVRYFYDWTLVTIYIDVGYGKKSLSALIPGPPAPPTSETVVQPPAPPPPIDVIVVEAFTKSGNDGRRDRDQKPKFGDKIYRKPATDRPKRSFVSAMDDDVNEDDVAATEDISVDDAKADVNVVKYPVGPPK